MIDTWIYPLRCGHQVALSSAIVDKKRKNLEQMFVLIQENRVYRQQITTTKLPS